jgi:thiol-disulfide isomerase/thioredoxin
MKMKNAVLTVVLTLVGLSCFATDKDSLVGHSMPLLEAKTLDGKTVDAAFYAGHVTLVSFMYIGCQPCMNEISVLNKIRDEYAANSQVQVLCVANHMKDQMQDFNARDTTMMSEVRSAMKLDSMRYMIQPACPDGVKKSTRTVINGETNISLKCECNTILEAFHFTAYPTTFFVDKTGMIRRIDKGGPGQKNDLHFYNGLREELEKLLAE